MNISNEEFSRLSDLVKNGAITAITIDTNIVFKNQRSLEGGLVGQLVQFGETHFRMLLSEVVVGEVKVLLETAHEERLLKVRSLRHHVARYLEDSDLVDDLFDEIDSLPIAVDLASRDVYRFIDETRAEVIYAKDVTAAELLELYFASEPPFAKAGNKKSEFPDAIALLGLKKWSDETGGGVLVVSSDNDWVRFCQNCESGKLHCLDNLGEALAIINDSDEARTIAAQTRLEEAVRLLVDRQGALFKGAEADLQRLLLTNMSVTATSDSPFKAEVIAIDHRDCLRRPKIEPFVGVAPTEN